MSKADEPAFPTIASRDEDLFFSLPGLTKREYFAGLAMQGILSGNPSNTWSGMAGKHAGALLAELEKKALGGQG